MDDTTQRSDGGEGQGARMIKGDGNGNGNGNAHGVRETHRATEEEKGGDR